MKKVQTEKIDVMRKRHYPCREYHGYGKRSRPPQDYVFYALCVVAALLLLTALLPSFV